MSKRATATAYRDMLIDYSNRRRDNRGKEWERREMRRGEDRGGGTEIERGRARERKSRECKTEEEREKTKAREGMLPHRSSTATSALCTPRTAGWKIMRKAGMDMQGLGKGLWLGYG